MLQEFCRIAGTSAGIDQSAEPLASIFGVKNDDPTFFFARINSHAQEHTYENQLRGDLQSIFYLSLLGLTISLVLVHLFGTDIGTILFYAD
jgi:hypothetical protein